MIRIERIVWIGGVLFGADGVMSFQPRTPADILFRKSRSNAASLHLSVKRGGYEATEGYSRSLNKDNRLRRFFGIHRSDPGRAHLQVTSEMMGGKGKSVVTRRAKQPGTLILVRNGSSDECNDFTGWKDPELSERGQREMEHAARLIRESGYDLDVVFSSRLKRCIHSAWSILREMDELYLPIFKAWRLNGRNYGALEGLSKAEVALQKGEAQVQKWRLDLNAIPPPVSKSDPNWHGNDPRYADLGDSCPQSESTGQCFARTSRLWTNRIKRELEVGHNVLVVGHGASLRGLIKHIQDLSDKEAAGLRIPPGSPIIFDFDKKMRPSLPKAKQDNGNDILKASFLEKPGALQEALQKEEEWRKQVPGYDNTMNRANRAMSSLERSLTKLQAERELREFAEDVSHLLPTSSIVSHQVEVDSINGDPTDRLATQADLKAPLVSQHPCLAPLPDGVDLPSDLKLPPRKASTIVMIRHGKTEHNKLGLFTGWEDPPLAIEGLEEARLAGQMLKKNGFDFDVVYTSWLSRAIETAFLVLDGLDRTWLPVIKTWRLNERMYGDLTGRSKKMVARMFSEDQFHSWRRGYKVRPPPVSSFSTSYPGNDRRYVKFLTDVRYSVSESIIRSIERRRLTWIRKFPKTECLKDCNDRTIPYLVHNIMPEVNKGKRVLIASSENAIRGLLMHLCDIPESKIAGLNIPNGIPIIYDVASRTVKLVDEGDGKNLLEKYDFGEAAEYLFAKADDAVDMQDEVCDIGELSDEAWEALHNVYNKTPLSIPIQGKVDPSMLPPPPKTKKSKETVGS